MLHHPGITYPRLELEDLLRQRRPQKNMRNGSIVGEDQVSTQLEVVELGSEAEVIKVYLSE